MGALPFVDVRSCVLVHRSVAAGDDFGFVMFCAVLSPIFLASLSRCRARTGEHGRGAVLPRRKAHTVRSVCLLFLLLLLARFLSGMRWTAPLRVCSEVSVPHCPSGVPPSPRVPMLRPLQCAVRFEVHLRFVSDSLCCVRVSALRSTTALLLHAASSVPLRVDHEDAFCCTCA